MAAKKKRTKKCNSKLELLCASQLNDTLLDQRVEGGGISGERYPLLSGAVAGAAISRCLSLGRPPFLAAVYFICCKQKSHTHLRPLLTALPALNLPRSRQTLGALSVVALHGVAVFHFYFQIFQQFFIFVYFLLRAFLRFGSFCTAR